MRAVDGETQTDQVRNARVFAADAQTYPGSKTEPRQQNWNSRKLPGKKIERGANVVLLPLAAVVNARAESCAAKIESQNRNPSAIQRFCGLIDHFVVHRPAKQRVRMTDHGGERRPLTRGDCESACPCRNRR